MEKTLDDVANDALKLDNVTGYLCADNNGLCLASAGVADKELCPTLVRVSQLVSKLEENTKGPVVIGIDTDNYKIYLKQMGQTTTAIYKKY